MKNMRIFMLALCVLGMTAFVSCKKETAEDKAKSGFNKLGEAASQTADDAKKAADEAQK
jgi:hypothetical protein